MMFTGSEIKAIAERIRTAAQDELGEKYLVTYKSGSYGDTLSLKFEVAKADASGTIQTQAMLDFTALATQLGLAPDDLGGKVNFGNHWYKVVGLKPGAWKRPIIIEDVASGERLVTSEESIKRSKLAGPSSWQPAS